MVDSERQVDAPSAFAWSIDLGGVGGPAFVVHRRDEDDARRALVEHLVAIGSRSRDDARRIVAGAEATPVAVIW